MDLHIIPSPDQEAFIREAIASGRFATAEEAAREALRQWEERERRRKEILVELDAAEASLARGEGRRVTRQSVQDLAKDVKRRGRSRLRSNR
jgi:putative addiction module CopG family antidote